VVHKKQLVKLEMLSVFNTFSLLYKSATNALIQQLYILLKFSIFTRKFNATQMGNKKPS